MSIPVILIHASTSTDGLSSSSKSDSMIAILFFLTTFTSLSLNDLLILFDLNRRQATQNQAHLPHHLFHNYRQIFQSENTPFFRSHCSWEPIEHLSGCKALISLFEEKLRIDKERKRTNDEPIKTAKSKIKPEIKTDDESVDNGYSR